MKNFELKNVSVFLSINCNILGFLSINCNICFGFLSINCRMFWMLKRTVSL